ncbi:MAG TPA: YraN family protein [Tepidisphaeraceae bacterium]|nr:YraN family protein [Tepidisphaeraceae bacterium]
MPKWVDWLQGKLTTLGAAAGGASGNGAGDDPKRREKKDQLADRGENLAAKHLQKLGYRILNRNLDTPVGEIDIVARDGKTLVFVEVKTRAYDEPSPEEQIDAGKVHRLTKAAKFFLGRYGQPHPPARFDVIAVVWPQGQPPVLRHIENAFEPSF